MKILKIELQNLNSLKSNNPIVIDFQNEHFKDVGLYAITGATGAGKTTILDAITIALYHNVPRFNKTKGTLLDVVSFGTNEAFCAVTFENNNNIYEGYWGIRLTNKTGIQLKNPIEKVSLKNISTEEILADQKKKYIQAVEKVTQLDYTQFLRSVMLAQGDFASFLSAKGPDKGKLLEQITGEDVYKKIGQNILDRKSKEENILKELETSLNAEDTLKEEERIALETHQNENKLKITELESELKTVKNISDWYTKYQNLLLEGTTIEKNSKEIELFIERNQKDLDLLTLHEKATPFKELLLNINRIENTSKEKETNVTLLNKELSVLDPDILKAETYVKALTGNFKKTETDIQNWQPKFDTVLKIESEIKHLTETKLKNEENVKNLDKIIHQLLTDVKDLNLKIEANAFSLKSLRNYTNENKLLIEVDAQISSWTTDLITLKNQKNTLTENEKFLFEKNTIIKKSNHQLDIKAQEFNKKEKDFIYLEHQLKLLSESLKTNSIANLILKKDTLLNKENNWKLLLQHSEKFINLSKENRKLLDIKKTLLKEVLKQEQELLTVHKSITAQDNLVADAQRILDLERSIKNYEEDRLKLVAGEACGLCGSTEHPFVSHKKEINLPKTESDLKDRKTRLLKLTNSKNELEKNVEITKANSENLTNQVKAINTEIASIITKASDLKFDCQLSDTEKIKEQLTRIKSEVLNIETQLKENQNLQLQKDKLSLVIKDQTNTIHTSKVEIAKLKESIKHDKEEVIAKQKLNNTLTNTCTLLECDLKTRLTTFKYTLPTPENTQQFITDIENSILIFNSKSKELITLKNQEAKFHLQLKNTQKTLISDTKERSDFNIKNNEIQKHIETETRKRIAILPATISVITKRNELQSLENKVNKDLQENTKELQTKLKLKAEKVVLKNKNSEEHTKNIKELKSLNTTFKEQITSSVFNTKEAVKNALLDKERKESIEKNKERIQKNVIKISTLKTEFKKDIDALLKLKTFTIDETENNLKLAVLHKKQKEFMATAGGIVERFRKDQEIRDRNKDIYLKIDAQAKICNTWKQLFYLTGNSKDAFNVYVQRITLQNLLKLANIHLSNLNKRYSLKMESSYKKGEELNFNLIDHYQTDQSRLVDTSSGGEKFIISLALALGLSDLASKNVKIDSLFIDEGFGTLDTKTLETVITTLETLQSQGKVIGIISHIENLKERIPTQIKISKKSNGVSVVKIV